MKEKDVDVLSAFFDRWKGANASFNRYVDDHDRLIVALVNASNPEVFVGVTFTYCAYLSGPTRWSNCRIECSPYTFGDGKTGFEFRDDSAGFVLRCYGPIVLGDDGRVIPRT